MGMRSWPRSLSPGRGKGNAPTRTAAAMMGSFAARNYVQTFPQHSDRFFNRCWWQRSQTIASDIFGRPCRPVRTGRILSACERAGSG